MLPYAGIQVLRTKCLISACAGMSGNGMRVDAAVNGLRLTGIEFDTHTLRVIAEASGAVKVAVSKLQ
jgi:hypothetical protein